MRAAYAAQEAEAAPRRVRSAAAPGPHRPVPGTEPLRAPRRVSAPAGAASISGRREGDSCLAWSLLLVPLTGPSLCL